MPLERIDSLFESRYDMLRTHHVHDLPRRQAEVLTLHSIGLDDQRVALELSLAIPTVRNEAAACRSRVIPASLEHTRAVAVAWAWSQRECCMAGWFRMTFRDSRFAQDRFRQLSVTHSPALSPAQSQLMIVQAVGIGDREAGAALGIRRHTVQNRASQARELSLPPDVAATTTAAVAWVYAHLRCCLGSVEMARDILFRGNDSLVS